MSSGQSYWLLFLIVDVCGLVWFFSDIFVFSVYFVLCLVCRELIDGVSGRSVGWVLGLGLLLVAVCSVWCFWLGRVYCRVDIWKLYSAGSFVIC